MTFKELVFNPHPAAYLGFGVQAIHEFPNGYGISVINGKYAHCDDHTYEVAILKDGHLTYDTPLTQDVLNYQTEKDIDNILSFLENYQPSYIDIDDEQRND